MDRLSRYVAAARYLGVVGAAAALLASLAAFGWSSYETFAMLGRLFRGETRSMALTLVRTMDSFLIASALLIFAFGLYELFVGKMPLPEGLVISDIDELKSKIVGLIFVVLAGSFLERLETTEDAKDILYVGVAIALVNGTLAWFRRDSR